MQRHKELSIIHVATDFWSYYQTLGLKSSPTDALGQGRTGWSIKIELSHWVGQKNSKSQLQSWSEPTYDRPWDSIP